MTVITDGFTTVQVARPQMGSTMRGTGRFINNIASPGIIGYGQNMQGTGIISKGLGFASDVSGFFGLGKKKRKSKQQGKGLLSTGLKIGSGLADMFGFGHPMHNKVPSRRLKMHGQGSVGDYMKKAVKIGHSIIKDNKLLSKGARHLLPKAGLSKNVSDKAGDIIETMGYGKKRRSRRK